MSRGSPPSFPSPFRIIMTLRIRSTLEKSHRFESAPLFLCASRSLLVFTCAYTMASEGSKELPVRPAEGQDANANAPPKAAKANAASNTDSLPDFIIERNKLFEELWQQYLEELKNKPHPEINVLLDLGNGNPSPVPAKAWETTPGSFLRDVPKDISANVVLAKIDGKELWDLNRPLERDCTVSFVPFESPEGREVFWHSSAHCLGEACECEYGCLLSHGPPTPQGFFYDMAMPDKSVSVLRFLAYTL
jgi:threonyl-tRNA synthetase